MNFLRKLLAKVEVSIRPVRLPLETEALTLAKAELAGQIEDHKMQALKSISQRMGEEGIPEVLHGPVLNIVGDELDNVELQIEGAPVPPPVAPQPIVPEKSHTLLENVTEGLNNLVHPGGSPA